MSNTPAPYPSSFTESVRSRLAELYRADEERLATELIPVARLTPAQWGQAQRDAERWIAAIRSTKRSLPGIAEMLSRFGLNSREGTALMCLAEALLRIPDTTTADALIRDKLGAADFEQHLAQGDNWLVRAAGWTLNLTGKIVADPDSDLASPGAMLGLLNNRLGHSAIREAIRHAMTWLGNQFVLGTDIQSALARAAKLGSATARFSYDMLGEAARTQADVDHYFADYLQTIRLTGVANRAHPALAPSGVSVKLSALHPRYEALQAARVYSEMVPRLITLAEAAAAENIFLIVDAEEADRLLLSLTVIEQTLAGAKLGDWSGFGLAVQAYSKRAGAVIDGIAALAAQLQRRLTVRLIKGAYWDTEVKRAQERGWNDFPVFTRKITTDVSYLACAKKLLAYDTWLTPVFGTHNALTAASILALAPDKMKLEFQRLQGMGEELFAQLEKEGIRTSVYAPVGSHEILLGYLVRRLLENGANSSFVNQLSDPRIPLESLLTDPVARLESLPSKRHPKVTLPKDIFTPERVNAPGLDLTDPAVTDPLLLKVNDALTQEWSAKPLCAENLASPIGSQPLHDPADSRRVIGQCCASTLEQADLAVAHALRGYQSWHRRPITERSSVLELWADGLLAAQAECLALLVREAGKTLNDALAEVREAVDFCRYYAARSKVDCAMRLLPGVTGERNELWLEGRGVFVCISPWNFPLAIFVGQMAAALAAGNSVIAKPAPQTPLIAALACRLAHAAGVPLDVIQLLPGDGAIGAALVAHNDIAGVAFTGSLATAQTINRALAQRSGAIIPFIAETGGQNAMLIDSSALPDQVIDDVITSSFRSAGQRCSALRLLCLPEATADKIITMLKAAMHELVVGDPFDLATDIGPVIDAAAVERLQRHILRLRAEANVIYIHPLPEACATGSFFSPQLWEIPSVSFLTEEVFGPILHIVRYRSETMAEMIEAINATGFGLTGGLHSRIADTAAKVTGTLRAGNIYINRSMIGAVVGSQPFGGLGLSGTGPKAGGPLYLPRFTHERCISTNTVAAGGNASLLAAAGED